MMKRYSILLISLILFLFVSFAEAATPPTQPATTVPGGSGRYDHTSSHVQTTLGRRESSVHIFEPRPNDQGSYPVLVFCHGTFGMSPSWYSAFIRHFTKQGIIVIYPVWMSFFTPSSRWVNNCGQNTKTAIDHLLANPSMCQPDLTKIGCAGHSNGATNALMMAAQYSTWSLPRFDFCVPIFPYRTTFNASTAALLDSNTAVNSISVDGDYLASDRCSKSIITAITGIGNTEKCRTHLNTESYSGGRTSGGHMSINGSDGGEETMMYFGWWKIVDGMCDYKWSSTNKNYCLVQDPNTAPDPNYPLRYMGKWSDNHPHTPADVYYYNDSTLVGGMTVEPLQNLEGFFTFDPNNLADGEGQTKQIAVTGSKLGDFVVVSAPYDLQDMIATGYVQADGTVEFRLQNETGGAIDLTSGVWNWRIIKK